MCEDHKDRSASMCLCKIFLLYKVNVDDTTFSLSHEIYVTLFTKFFDTH